MALYRHAFDIAFSVKSKDPKGKDITTEDLKDGLYRRIEDLDSEGDRAWQEAVGELESYDEAPSSKRQQPIHVTVNAGETVPLSVYQEAIIQIKNLKERETYFLERQKYFNSEDIQHAIQKGADYDKKMAQMRGTAAKPKVWPSSKESFEDYVLQQKSGISTQEFQEMIQNNVGEEKTETTCIAAIHKQLEDNADG